MNKNKLNFFVDLLGYLAFVGLAATGILMAYRLPAGSGSAAMLGLTRHDWGDVHFYLAAALVALVVLHVVLHWRWVTNTFGALLTPRTPRQPGAGLGGTTALLALGVATAALLAAPWILGVEGAGRGRGAGEGHGTGYRGGRGAGAGSENAAAGPQAPGGTASADPASKERTSGTQTATGQAAGAGGQDIRGSMTLAEAAAAAEVDLARLIAALNLPAGTPGAARLGRLRQEHGFTMEDVRNAVARLKTAK